MNSRLGRLGSHYRAEVRDLKHVRGNAGLKVAGCHCRQRKGQGGVAFPATPGEDSDILDSFVDALGELCQQCQSVAKPESTLAKETASENSPAFQH